MAGKGNGAGDARAAGRGKPRAARTATLSGSAAPPVTWAHTLVLGSGAAGLAAAVHLRAMGVRDVLVLTEGLRLGTSINTGSDKQTYYKLGMCGAEADSPAAMAESYVGGGGMHGDLALVEAALSPLAFMHLVGLGVPFPRDRFGQFVGYKTDHDPRQRATSIGPYTSREMCRALIRRVQLLQIPVRERRRVVQVLTVAGRAAGALALGPDDRLEAYGAENVVFALGGPGGLYRASVYPPAHTGGIGIAMMAGADCRSLPESQYGLASTRFRWNVSGTYMQVVPRFVSTAADGVSDGREFLRAYFPDAGAMNSAVFLKGYQWPFDARKAVGGSSIVDILVYIETVRRGRRVFLDFRADPAGFRFGDLSREASDYLSRSGALLATPIARLAKMNPGAVELYKEHGIDLRAEPLEIAVCAQHNNGGLAGTAWWESTNIPHLFPVGEVNGSHGVYRPGGSALNAGQVGAFRAAEYIAGRYAGWTVSKAALRAAAARAAAGVRAWAARSAAAPADWRAERRELQERMSRAGAHIRAPAELARACAEAWAQVERLEERGCSGRGTMGLAQALCTRQLAFAHAVYLDAVRFALDSGTGSRGSAIVLKEGGQRLHPGLDAAWSIAPEDPAFRDRVQKTTFGLDGRPRHAWEPRRPIPTEEAWFETTWARFRTGEVYG